MAIATPVLAPDITTTPPGPRHGLLDVATIVDDPDPHWVNGREYWPTPTPTISGGLDVSCGPFTPDVWPDGIPTVTDAPFRVRAGFTCRTIGITDVEVEQYAARKLAVSEGPSVEAIVWPTIIAGADTPAGTSPVRPVGAVGALEQWLYRNYGGVGVIHAPRSMVAALRKANAVTVTDGQLSTLLGTPIIAGNYPGTALAATANIEVRRSAPQVFTRDQQWVDPTTNEVTGVAERIYLVSFDQLAATVGVDLTDPAPATSGPNLPGATNFPGPTNYPGE